MAAPSKRTLRRYTKPIPVDPDPRYSPDLRTAAKAWDRATLAARYGKLAPTTTEAR